MQTIDMIVALTYALFFIHMQYVNWKIIPTAGVSGIKKPIYTIFFIGTYMYTSFTRSKEYRNGALCAMIASPALFYILGMKYSGMVNAVFIGQTVLYMLIGCILTYIHRPLKTR